MSEYKFLGVTIDSGLRFKSHVNRVEAKCRKRNNILRCLAGKDWGQGLETQKALYLTYVRSAMEYASSSWYPWISKTAKKRLERVQNESLRIMTRLCKTCPKDFLSLETGIELLKVRMGKNNKIIWEKYARLNQNDSRRKLVDKEGAPRLKSRQGWRYLTKPAMEIYNYNRETSSVTIHPWSPLNVQLDYVQLVEKKIEYSGKELRELTEKKIQAINADIQI